MNFGMSGRQSTDLSKLNACCLAKQTYIGRFVTLLWESYKKHYSWTTMLNLTRHFSAFFLTIVLSIASGDILAALDEYNRDIKDLNGNGIRDDVDREINRFTDDARERVMLRQYSYFVAAPLEENHGYRLGQMFFQSLRVYLCMSDSGEKSEWLIEIKARTLDSEEALIKHFESESILTSMDWITRLGSGVDCNYGLELDEEKFGDVVESAFEFDVCKHIRETAKHPEEPLTKMDIQSCEDAKVLGY